MVHLNIEIPDNLAARLGTLATKTGKTSNYYILAALKEKIEELEDHHLAIQTLKKVKAGNSCIWSHEDIKNDRDLEN